MKTLEDEAFDEMAKKQGSWGGGFQAKRAMAKSRIPPEKEEMTTKDEQRHMSLVAELGCAVCRRIGYEGTPAELHHPRAGTGAGRRASHMDVIPLCPEHHRGKTGVHGLGTKGFPRHYGYGEAELLEDTRAELKKLIALRIR